ncbi:MAG: helix-turn-helix transcriptional regulator, partial [Gemmataceae bacterium]
DRYLQDHAGRPFGVEDIAAAVDLSRSQLTRLYRQHFGMGPAERLRTYRVQKASALLRGTTLPVKVVAHMCGFTCPNHFCRVFLQVMKTKPTDYRAQNERR